MKLLSSEKLPIKLWLEDIEEGSLAQAKNLANLPFTFKHVAIMPDSHQGYGMPIGGVLATDGIVVPNAVGVDIGCGMCAVKTSLTEIDTETLKRIMGEIRKQIPVGFEHHKIAQDKSLMPLCYFSTPGQQPCVVDIEYDKARKQLGTLGGGNHFIEVQKGSDGHIWIMIHSGSRNFGLKIATHYNNIAKELNAKWHSGIDPKWDLAFLSLDSDEGKSYMAEMQYAVDFALANRKLMMQRILEIVYKETSATDMSHLFDGHDESIINIAHNYASIENHYGKNVVVHRKGATSANDGEIGIIPGSQGTKSYIVRGLGNNESFRSCSHGAGRKMGRGQAQRELDLQKEINLLDEKGIIHAIRGKSDLDEAPGAYKDIDVVMENQKDLVEIIVELTPLAVIKG